MPSDKVKRLASSVLTVSFKSFKHPFYKRSPPHPGHSFTLLLSCARSVIVQLSVLFQYSLDRSFRVHFDFLHSQGGKLGKWGIRQRLVLAPVPLKIERIGTRERRKVDRYRGRLNGGEAAK